MSERTEPLLDAEPFTEQAAENDDDERGKQQVGSDGLASPLRAGQRGREEQPACHVRRGVMIVSDDVPSRFVERVEH